MIKGKTPEEIRKTFNIKNDFTEEEEAQVVFPPVICLYAKRTSGVKRSKGEDLPTLHTENEWSLLSGCTGIVHTCQYLHLVY
ncbi:hypothetical protein FQN60_000491 [Etheostoma spectabile]|uniref:SKP1 component dimerisation domain-containing protein n=1 Tax=Etheostoma spectabile TaxID=54343 RepID=A0A5J5D288_9PERO|nr:hypothetical protein FQN60_000491 [Etheostoma spectabile]